MKIGADDPIIGERMNAPEEHVFGEQPAKKRSAIGLALRITLLVVTAPAVIHAAWDLAKASWGWGG